MNFFSKLFSSAKPTSKSPDKTKHLDYLRSLFNDEAEIFSNMPLFNQHERCDVPYMLLHPKAGVVLFNYFNYDAQELKGVTASVAKGEQSEDADLKTQGVKRFILKRFDEIFHTAIAPVRSILICSHLNEEEFDALDESFHALIPKGLTLFNDASDEAYKRCFLSEDEHVYDLCKIKQALFSELIIPHTSTLMNPEQEAFVHHNLSDDLLLHGHPGTGKSTLLVAKALYEKMKNPELKLLLLGKRTCNVNTLKALIFAFVENAHWGINPADIAVSSFDTIRRRCSEKEKYDLLLCDDVNGGDINALRQLLDKNGQLLASSHYTYEAFENQHQLNNNYRLSPALTAACEGLKVENLKESLSFLSGNVYMNVILTIASLLKVVTPDKITLVHQNKEELLQLQSEIDDYFTPISYLFDADRQEGLGLYPISHLPCLLNKYMIIIIDEQSQFDPIELISRAYEKSFILSQSEEAYNVIQSIKQTLNDA